MKKLIIAVCCENYEVAKKAYETWLEHLLNTEPESVQGYNKASLCVEVDKIFRYVFFDSHLDLIFLQLSDQMFYQNDFFELEGIETDGFKWRCV